MAPSQRRLLFRHRAGHRATTATHLQPIRTAPADADGQVESGNATIVQCHPATFLIRLNSGTKVRTYPACTPIGFRPARFRHERKCSACKIRRTPLNEFSQPIACREEPFVETLPLPSSMHLDFVHPLPPRGLNGQRIHVARGCPQVMFRVQPLPPHALQGVRIREAQGCPQGHPSVPAHPLRRLHAGQICKA
jgi:hypothetical protein